MNNIYSFVTNGRTLHNTVASPDMHAIFLNLLVIVSHFLLNSISIHIQCSFFFFKLISSQRCSILTRCQFQPHCIYTVQLKTNKYLRTGELQKNDIFLLKSPMSMKFIQYNTISYYMYNRFTRIDVTCICFL